MDSKLREIQRNIKESPGDVTLLHRYIRRLEQLVEFHTTEANESRKQALAAATKSEKFQVLLRWIDWSVSQGYLSCYRHVDRDLAPTFTTLLEQKGYHVEAKTPYESRSTRLSISWG